MKLLRVHVIAAQTCGGLLDGMDIRLRPTDVDFAKFDPLCLIGPNGSGKSQFLQVLAEIFQTVCHACVPTEERLEGNAELLFEVEYLIRAEGASTPVHVRASRKKDGKGKPAVQVEMREGDSWVACDATGKATRRLLPAKIIGYTSGENETLSMPFLVSRSGYAREVATAARGQKSSEKRIPDTRLMLVDYGTNLEVLTSNLILGEVSTRQQLLLDLGLSDIHSCRCIVQIAGGPVRRLPGGGGVRLTRELTRYIDNLKRCSTCHDFNSNRRTHVFDFWVNDHTRQAFAFFWESAGQLFSALHKLAMLNDLALPKEARTVFTGKGRPRFASRTPEPPDTHKVFRFEQVRFRSRGSNDAVDYVSLSDGEHQLAQLLGTLAMQSFSNVLFLLDEPESHFNPQWRVKAVSRMIDLPTANGIRSDGGLRSLVAEQECLLTTHAPFVPSDMPRDRVFIFSKVDGKIRVAHPDVETYGTTFDSILEACFGVVPPISEKSRSEIEDLRQSDDPKAIEEALPKLGSSVQKAFLRDRLRQLTSEPRDR